MQETYIGRNLKCTNLQIDSIQEKNYPDGIAISLACGTTMLFEHICMYPYIELNLTTDTQSEGVDLILSASNDFSNIAANFHIDFIGSQFVLSYFVYFAVVIGLGILAGGIVLLQQSMLHHRGLALEVQENKNYKKERSKDEDGTIIVKDPKDDYNFFRTGSMEVKDSFFSMGLDNSNLRDSQIDEAGDKDKTSFYMFKRLHMHKATMKKSNRGLKEGRKRADNLEQPHFPPVKAAVQKNGRTGSDFTPRINYSF